MNTTSRSNRLTNLLRFFFLLAVLLTALVGPGLLPAQAAAPQARLQSLATLEASEDTWLRQAYPTNNYGGDTTVSTSQYSVNRRNSLFRWDLGSIPAGSVVSSASITFYVLDTSTYDYGLYQMRRAWVEGTNNDAISNSSANWNTTNGAAAWGTAGAMNTSNDRYATDLWDATAATFGITGTVTIPLNANGIAVLQSWINAPSSNFGVTVQSLTTGNTIEHWDVASSENPAYAGPTLNIDYGPVIIPSGSLTAFTTFAGYPSTAQTYTVAGARLSGPVTIAAPVGYQLSLDGTNYDDSLILAPTGGTLGDTTIYVRLYSPTAGTYSGNIAHTSPEAVTKNLAVTGTVTAGCSATLTTSLVAVEDTHLLSANPAVNYGNSATLEVDRGNQDRTALLKWDLGSLPGTTTLTAVSMTINVTDASTYAYPLYRLRRSWVENSATWDTYNGTNTWGTAGASSTTSDRENTNLWTSTGSFGLGSRTIPLNASGVGVVQGWIANPAQNFGLIIQNYGGGTNNLIFSSSEAAAGLQPTLNLTYCAPAIITTGLLDAFTAFKNVPSDEQSYTVAGVHLSADLVVTAPPDFEISTSSGGPYSDSLTLAPTGGTVAPTPIFVRFLRSTAGTSSGDITHASAGAATVNVPVSGTATNRAPQASLVGPGDGSSNVTLPPDLTVTVNDEDGDPMDVLFFGGLSGSGTYPLVGSATGQASGSNASVSWPGLTTNVIYEWYFTVSDGTDNIESSHWTFTAGSPTAVTVTNFRAEPGDAGVTIRWETATEIGLTGFILYRSPSPDEHGDLLAFVPAVNLGGLGTTAYEYTDPLGEDETWYYWLEVVGTGEWLGPLGPLPPPPLPYKVMLPLLTR